MDDSPFPDTNERQRNRGTATMSLVGALIVFGLGCYNMDPGVVLLAAWLMAISALLGTSTVQP